MPARNSKKRVRDMGLAFAIVLAIPVVSTGTVLAVFLLSSRDDEAELPARCDDATPVERLSSADVGTIVVAKGTVADSRRTAEGVFLDLGNDYPEQKLSLLIRDGSIENWTMAPEQQYDSREIAFAGELKRADGSLQVEARSPGDLAVCP